MAAEDGFDTAAALSALASTTSVFSDTLQLASMVCKFVPGMSGVAGVIGGISSAFDKASKVLDAVDKVRATCDEMIEIYNQHPDPDAHPQVAGALITKAFTLVESGRPAEALPVYDDLVRRFGADTDPSVVRLVRAARINATATLNKLQRLEETLTRTGEIVERYGTDPDPAVAVDVLSARLNRMEALAGLQRYDEAISCFDEIVAICDGLDHGGDQALEVRVRQDHVSALSMKSMTLLQQGKPGEALAACDEVVQRFGADPHAEVQGGVTRCLLARAKVLHHFGRWQEEIDAYDEILAAYAKDRSLRDAALAAGYFKIGLLAQLGRFEDAVHACDDMRQRFRNDQPAQVVITVFEVEVYRGLGLHEKAVTACDEVDDLIGSDPDVGYRPLVASTLRLKALSLGALGRQDESLSVSEEIDQRYGDDPALPLRQAVAQALLDKGRTLGLLGRRDEAAAVMDTIVARYGQDADPVLQQMSERARSNKIALDSARSTGK
jgi:tetratricopeptide (TPR) repeat protein